MSEAEYRTIKSTKSETRNNTETCLTTVKIRMSKCSKLTVLVI